jgi:hypothetical protein
MRSSLPTNLARAWRALASESSTVRCSFGQDIQGVSSPRDSLTAACISGPSPGRGLRIRSRSVSKLSEKSLSIRGFVPSSLPFGAEFPDHSRPERWVNRAAEVLHASQYGYPVFPCRATLTASAGRRRSGVGRVRSRRELKARSSRQRVREPRRLLRREALPLRARRR